MKACVRREPQHARASREIYMRTQRVGATRLERAHVAEARVAELVALVDAPRAKLTVDVTPEAEETHCGASS
eukprot:6212229-Pleurochrysis_carterae.AAC.4